MLLAIDVGNTRIKAAVFEHNNMVYFEVITKNELNESIKKIKNNFSKISDLIVSSVGNLDESVFLFESLKIKTHFVTHKSEFPFKNLYLTPDTLGIDRIILASGSVLLYPKQNRLIIDAGTCITYDFVDSNNNYQGGAISPGLKLRYKALNNYTDKLPLLELQMPENYIGNQTNQAIHSGVVNGVLSEINGFIENYRKDYDKITIILTGGDTEFLAKRLKNTIFANSNFLLESLNQTFHYKIKHD